jgi:hypothetical protein
VACSAIWFPLADEMKEIYSQFLQTLVNFGVPLKDASRSDKYDLHTGWHPLGSPVHFAACNPDANANTMAWDRTPVGIVMKTLVDIRRSSFTGMGIATGLAKSLLDLGVDLLDIMPLQTLGPSVLTVLGNEIFEEQGSEWFLKVAGQLPRDTVD